MYKRGGGRISVQGALRREEMLWHGDIQEMRRLGGKGNMQG